MAVIGVYSAKGGVGKTTIAVDLAWRSAVLSHHQTLLWDLDPQGASCFLLGCDQRRAPRAASVFQRDGRPHEMIEPTRYSRLSLFQADDSLRSLSVTLARIGHKRRLAQLTASMLNGFDRIFLDCPPVINEVSEQILCAADLLIVPIPASPLAMRTLDTVREELARHHMRQPPIQPVLSMYSSGRAHHREVRLGLAKGWPVVPLATEVESCAVRQAPFGSFAAGTRPDRALQQVWNAIEAKLAERIGAPQAVQAVAA